MDQSKRIIFELQILKSEAKGTIKSQTVARLNYKHAQFSTSIKKGGQKSNFDFIFFGFSRSQFNQKIDFQNFV